MSSPFILAEHLVKWYGPRIAVRDVSFSVDAGEVVGLLGPNGSGKSTIFRMLTGYLTPSSGSAVVAGYDAATQSLALRHEVGYVPEDAPLYDHMRVAEFLHFMARLKGLAGAAAGRAVEQAVARLHLEKVASLMIAKLSRGYRQRVAIAQALLCEPKLLILDEPTSGLDPRQVIALRDLIRDLQGKQTVLIASHVLSEIEQIASRVMILLEGRLLTSDALRQNPSTQRLRVDVAGTEAQIRDAIAAVPGVRAISARADSTGISGRYVVEAELRQQLAPDIAAALAENRLALFELAVLPPELEQVFLDLTRPAAGRAA